MKHLDSIYKEIYSFFIVMFSACILSVPLFSHAADGLFGTYFQRMTWPCAVWSVLTGFDQTSGSYGTRTCTTLSTMLGSIFWTTTVPVWQALVGFNADGTLRFGSVNWVRSGNTISYTGGNVGIGTTTPEKPLAVNGAIMADEFCFREKNECVKTFQQNLSNTQYFNIENAANDSDYYRYARWDIFRKEWNAWYLDLNETTLNKIGMANATTTNWFRVAGSYMQAYETAPRSLFVEQGDNLSPIFDTTISGSPTAWQNYGYCWLKRSSDGIELTTTSCLTPPDGWTVTSTVMCDQSKNHSGYVSIQYKLLTWAWPQCDSHNWSSIMSNASWWNPEVLNFRSTAYQSGPSAYSPDWCAYQNMHSQIVARIVITDYNTCTAGSLMQYAKDSPRTIKLKSIGISLLK